ncbi:hypothetical protein POKO110462_05505 [Pontibacter korlensis]
MLTPIAPVRTTAVALRNYNMPILSHLKNAQKN